MRYLQSYSGHQKNMTSVTPSVTASDDQRFSTLGHRDAESLFRTKPILEIRNVEAATRKQIQDKKEELRQLVGNRYRDLIDSADSIVKMKSSCQSISDHVSSIHHSIRSLSLSQSQSQGQPQQEIQVLSAERFRTYGIACRVKYLVDTTENIWGCLDEFMFLEAASRYVRAKHVYHYLFLENLSTDNSASDGDNRILSSFPVLQHQWQIVESFRAQISQRSRERLLDPGLGIKGYADALAAVAVIDELEPTHVFGLFLDTRKSWIAHKLATCATAADNGCPLVVSVICEVLRIIQVSVGQVGELFLQVLNDIPLFYKVISASPPASQLFGGIPNPDEEVRLWKLFRDKLESVMVMLDKTYIANTCFTWLRECGRQIVNKVGGRYLIDAIACGRELVFAEKSIRETMESKHTMEGSVEWLRTVFGSEVELPWNRIRELVLEDSFDLWDQIFEDAFVERMKVIINQGFDDLTKSVKVVESIHAIGDASDEQLDFQGSQSRHFTSGGVWFLESNARKSALPYVFNAQFEDNDFWSCLNAYFGPEISRIRDLVDSSCRSILLDFLCFLESQKASERLKNLGPYLQSKCYESILSMLMALRNEVDNLDSEVEKCSSIVHPTVNIERSLFIGRLLFALENHSRHISLILGSPRFWVNETPSILDNLPSSVRQSRVGTGSPDNDNLGWKIPSYGQRKMSFVTSALLGAGESVSPKLEELTETAKYISIRAYGLWISCLADELSVNLSHDLRQDDALSLTTSWKGWEDVIVKQEQSEEGGPSEMNLSLPSIPSLYVISFLFRASEEVHRVGGHVLEKKIIQNLALRLLEKVIGIYEDFLSTTETDGRQVSEKGVVQVLFDIRFAVDILSGADPIMIGELQGNTKAKFSAVKKQSHWTSATGERIDRLFNRLSQRLDPIDWLTYEPYLWENEKQSYLRHAVLFGFFVQLNRMYKDTVQKLPANSESNILRCCTVPRFKYLPISAPTLSSRGNTRKLMPASLDDISSRNFWNSFTNGEISQKINLDDHSSLGIAAPFLKSFMQVGSRFGESTLKLGSILSDGQVGMFKDRSAAAMSTFGDILPAQAAGLLSSFSASRSESL